MVSATRVESRMVSGADGTGETRHGEQRDVILAAPMVLPMCRIPSWVWTSLRSPEATQW